eukprot:747895-Hanusia_phi.AAC.2
MHACDVDGSESVVQFMQAQGRKGEVVAAAAVRDDSNPEQSKHLETATLKVRRGRLARRQEVRVGPQVLGFEIDFVNLRAEARRFWGMSGCDMEQEYTDTRIPTMRIGTALEDVTVFLLILRLDSEAWQAMRRDLTINALFYNVNDSCRFNFKLDRELEETLSTSEVRQALASKVWLLLSPSCLLQLLYLVPRFRLLSSPLILSPLISSPLLSLLFAMFCPPPPPGLLLFFTVGQVSKERVYTELNGMLLGPVTLTCPARPV